MPHKKSGCMAAIFTFSKSSTECLAKSGRPCMEDIGNPRKSSIEIIHRGDAFSRHEFLFNSLLGIEGLQIDEFAQSAHDKIAIIMRHPDGDAEKIANSIRVAAGLNRGK